MTAADARELTLKNRHDINKIYEFIKSIAKSGSVKAVFELNEIFNIDETKKELEDNGYVVIISSDYVSISW